MRYYSDEEVYEILTDVGVNSSISKWAEINIRIRKDNATEDLLLIMHLHAFVHLWGKTLGPTREQLMHNASGFSGGDSKFINNAVAYFDYIQAGLPKIPKLWQACLTAGSSNIFKRTQYDL